MYVEKNLYDEVALMARAWKMNDERNKGLRYADGTPKPFCEGKPDQNTDVTNVEGL